MAIPLGSLTLNIDLIVSLVSWFVLIPQMWFYYGFGSFEMIIFQIQMMTVHTTPIVSAYLNFWFL